MAGRRKSLEESFWRATDKRGPDECWPWTSAKNHKGYGYIVRRRSEGQRIFKASRVSWEIANGQPFPKGLLACHTCDNPSCVNPAHIWPGTPAQNMQDMRAKGRGVNMAHLLRNAPRRKTPERCIRCGHPRTDDLIWKRSDGTSRRRCRACEKRRWAPQNKAQAA